MTARHDHDADAPLATSLDAANRAANAVRDGQASKPQRLVREGTRSYWVDADAPPPAESERLTAPLLVRCAFCFYVHHRDHDPCPNCGHLAPPRHDLPAILRSEHWASIDSEAPAPAAADSARDELEVMRERVTTIVGSVQWVLTHTEQGPITKAVLRDAIRDAIIEPGAQRGGDDAT